jgi:Ni,Fe-hydrogenase III large subunit
MKRKIAIITSIIMLLAAGLASARDFEVTKKAGDLTVQVKIDKNPPVSGFNKIDVVIKDSRGMEIKDAAVIVEYIMPAMPGMPAMNYKTNADLKAGRYTATLNFSMSGAWIINVKIARGGKTQTVKLNVDVQ